MEWSGVLEVLAAARFPAGTPGFFQQRSVEVRTGRRRLAVILQAGNAAALLAHAARGSGLDLEGEAGLGGPFWDVPEDEPERGPDGGDWAVAAGPA